MLPLSPLHTEVCSQVYLRARVELSVALRHDRLGSAGGLSVDLQLAKFQYPRAVILEESRNGDRESLEN